MNNIELTDEQLDTLTDVLNHAKENTVTDREHAKLNDLHHQIVEQWVHND